MEVILNDTNIDTSLYTVLEYQQFIQPIFHTIMLSKYELKASKSKMKSLLKEIWDNVSTVKTEPLPMEYCNMKKTDNPDGTYTITPVEDKDDLVHADEANCPNMSAVQYHEDDVSKPLCSCDSFYYECDGHEGDCTHDPNCDDCAGGCTHKCGDDCKDGCTHECDDDCEEYCGHKHKEWKSASNPGCHFTDYHGTMSTDCGNSTKHLLCKGYRVCYGHKILSLTVELKDFDELLQLYYLDEIAALEAKDVLTADEQKKLRELNEYYQLCTEYIVVLVKEFGLASGELVTLDGVELTPLTAYACRFIGKPYIWGGTDPEKGADCSGFVRYVYAHFGTALPRVSADQVTVGRPVDSIADAQAGDLIFWSNDGTDSGVYHVAIYLGNNKIVHASNSKPYPNGGIKISHLYGIIYKIKRP
ncbi:MAG: C40 family peptidase [Acetatifactor sp.]|nr:C40 family peptidase [Acetatifactor sp.]